MKSTKLKAPFPYFGGKSAVGRVQATVPGKWVFSLPLLPTVEGDGV